MTERWTEARSHGVLGAKARRFGVYYQVTGDHWGMTSAVAPWYSRSSPLGLSCLTSRTRTDSSWSLFRVSTSSPLLPSSPSLLLLQDSSGVLSSEEACADASCRLHRGNSSAPISVPDTRGNTSLVSLIWSTATPWVRCYQTLGGTEALRRWEVPIVPRGPRESGPVWDLAGSTAYVLNLLTPLLRSHNLLGPFSKHFLCAVKKLTRTYRTDLITILMITLGDGDY